MLTHGTWINRQVGKSRQAILLKFPRLSRQVVMFKQKVDRLRLGRQVIWDIFILFWDNFQGPNLILLIYSKCHLFFNIRGAFNFIFYKLEMYDKQYGISNQLHPTRRHAIQQTFKLLENFKSYTLSLCFLSANLFFKP